jgi:hypothetical protein
MFRNMHGTSVSGYIKILIAKVYLGYAKSKRNEI